MATTEERKQRKKQNEPILDTVCNGNPDAREYLYLVTRALRIWDDVQDQDYEVTRENLLEAFEILFVQLPTNKFFVQNYDVLLSQHITIFNTWVAANEREKGDETDRMYSHVWAQGINELLPIVALLTKGYNHMRNTSTVMRRVFQEQLPKE
tara:strand:- start:393 stop:848 length:456 start_codon:yes stop_codon:yes gene_type:complete